MSGLSTSELQSLIVNDVVLSEVVKDSPEPWYLRHLVAATLGGVTQDWRFDVDDVLGQAKDRLATRGTTLTWSEDPAQSRVVALGCETARVRWRFSTVQGLMLGVNSVLEQSGRAERFLGLVSGGDEYFFVLCSPESVQALRASSLFEEWNEEDPAAGPA